jgi:hypothetical protein
MNPTQIFIAFALIIILGFDCVAYLKWGVQGTISWQVIDQSYKQPLLPFLAGVVMGHFFWQIL